MCQHQKATTLAPATQRTAYTKYKQDVPGLSSADFYPVIINSSSCIKLLLVKCVTCPVNNQQDSVTAG